MYEEENVISSVKDASPFYGQIGPTYLFSDAISSELVQGICSLGPSYMYYFLDNEISVYVDNFLSGGVPEAKDSLASKIIFGLNAQVLLFPSEIYHSEQGSLLCCITTETQAKSIIFSGK